MKLHHVYGATVVVFAFGVVTVGPAYAQRRDGSLLPQDQSGDVTTVGCLVRGSQVKGGNKDQYALARPRKGPVASVPEATCTADPGADALELDNTNRGVTDAMLGRWVQVSGRLESETSKDPDNLRELDVASIRLVPVVPPKTAAAPTPAPAAAPRSGPTTSRTGTGADACTGSDNVRASYAAEDGEPDSGGWIGRVALAGDGLHASFVPSPATGLMHRTRTATEGTTAHAVAPFVVVR